MNEKQETPEELFQEHEEDTHSRYLHQRGDRLKRLITLLGDQGRDIEKQQAIWEYALTLLHIRDIQESEERFGPMMVMGDGSQLPDPAIFTEEALDYYAQRVDKTPNPILRALYCDFLWEKRRDHRFARKAINEYLECVPIYLVDGRYHQVADAVSRVADLALRLKDDEESEKARTGLLDTIKKLVKIGKHPALRYCLDIIDALLSIRGKASDTDLKMALNVCEKGTAFYTSEAGGLNNHMAIDFEKRRVELWKRLGNDSERSNAEIRIGELYEKEAELRGGGNNMAGALFLQRAAEHYANIGRPDRVERLKIEVKKRWEAAVQGGEFKRVEVTAAFPVQKIEQYSHEIMKHGIDKALQIISTDSGLLPDIEESRKTAADQKTEFPLMGLIPQIMIEKDRQTAAASETEDIEEINSLRQYSIDHGMRMLFLSKVLDILREQGGLSAESFQAYLSTSPFFDYDKIELIGVGLERYFAGDYVSSIHILVPQLEDTLRRVIGKLGASTTALKSKGITHEKMLDTVFETPELKELLQKQVWFYFKHVLIHPLGMNLRHNIAHGLVNKGRCTKDTAETVLHLLLLLTPYQVV